MEKYPKNEIANETHNEKWSVKETWDRNKEEIKGITEPIIDKLSSDNLDFILMSYDLSPRTGDETLASVLSETLGIKTPKIVEDASMDSIGGYVFGRNEIKLNRERLKEDLHEEGEEDNIKEHELSTIAHETWHAFQEDCIRKNSPRSNIYKKSLNEYKSCHKVEDEDGFWGQILELEAEYFAFLVRKKLEAVM